MVQISIHKEYRMCGIYGSPPQKREGRYKLVQKENKEDYHSNQIVALIFYMASEKKTKDN